MGLPGSQDKRDNAKVRNEKIRLKMNMAYLIILAALDGVNYTSVTTTFHQFVINPRKESLGNQSDIIPGLGQSEQFYSWLITAYNTGSLLGPITAGISERLLVPSWYLLFGSILAHTIGFLIRAVTYQPALIFVSTTLAGYFVGVNYTLAYAYVAKASMEYEKLLVFESGDEATGRGASIRNQLYSLFLAFANVGKIVSNVAILIFLRFPSVHLFDAVSWFSAASGIFALVVFFLIFRERMTVPCLKLKESCSGPTKSVNILGMNIMELVLVLIFFYYIAISTIPFSLYETIFNPVISDSFGFSETNTPYFFIALGVLPFFGALTLLLFQCLEMRTHNIAIIGIVGSLVAISLMADWQSIPYDPCTEKSPFHHPNIVHNTTDYYSFSLPDEVVPAIHMIRKREVMVLTEQQTLIAVEECENTTYRGHRCHWIPKSSVIPSYYCMDCQPICRSPLLTLNFIQFSFGFILMYIFYPFNITAALGLVSDTVSKSMQGITMSLALTTSASFRIITPIWGDAVYEYAKKRTFLLMSIIIVFYLAALLPFILCYRRIARKKGEDKVEDDIKEEQKLIDH